MVCIKTPIQSDRSAVKSFLSELHAVIDAEDFDINNQLVFIKAGKTEEEYSAPYTIMDLEFDNEDVITTFKELAIQEYSETLVDKDNDDPPLLYVFGKQINQRQVYIKLKIREGRQKAIICVSFHYSKHEMSFPYGR